MDTTSVTNNIDETAQSLFNAIRHVDGKGNEYWHARELADALGYAEWRNFENVVEKAKISVVNGGGSVENHFVGFNKMVEVGSNTVRRVRDVKLSRYACYIISQNGDPTKNEIALAQAYFAQQTRRQELATTHTKELERIVARQKLTVSDKELSRTVLRRGVDQVGLAAIKSQGDEKLFGGKTTREMKAKYGIKSKSKPLADHLPTISLTAKQLANEMTTLNTKVNDLHGVVPIGGEHVKNNGEIRKSLLVRGIKLEDLPPEEDIKKVTRRIKVSNVQSPMLDE